MRSSEPTTWQLDCTFAYRSYIIWPPQRPRDRQALGRKEGPEERLELF